MSYLPVIALLSFLSFPCAAETVEEQFSRMDLNRDGFLSEQEFIQGMERRQTESPNAFDSTPVNQPSPSERKRMVDETVADARKMLPFKVDQATTWTEIYGENDEIHYVYRIDMDVASMPAEQAGMMRSVLEAQICPKIKSAMCGVANEILLKNGISLHTHYNDKTGVPLAGCRFTGTDCQ